MKGFRSLRENHPYLWEEIRALSNEGNLVSKYFIYDMTFEEVEARMDALEAQGKLFNE